jgi:hypothetical protein
METDLRIVQCASFFFWFKIVCHLHSKRDVAPHAVYDGGYHMTAHGQNVRLRIGNGGAGQSGLIGAWANAFIEHCVTDLGFEPFQVSLTCQ